MYFFKPPPSRQKGQGGKRGGKEGGGVVGARRGLRGYRLLQCPKERQKDKTQRKEKSKTDIFFLQFS